MLLKCILLPLSILCFLIGTGLVISGAILPGILGEAALFAIRDSLVVSSSTDNGGGRGSYDKFVKIQNKWTNPYYIANLTLENKKYHYEYVGPFVLQTTTQNVNVSFEVVSDSTIITYREDKTYTWPNQTDLADAITDGDFIPNPDLTTVTSWEALKLNVLNTKLLGYISGAGNDYSLAAGLIEGTVNFFVSNNVTNVTLASIISSENATAVPISFYNILLLFGKSDSFIKGLYGAPLNKLAEKLTNATDLGIQLANYVHPQILPALKACLFFGTGATTTDVINGITAERQVHAYFYLYLTILTSSGAGNIGIGGGLVIEQSVEDYLMDDVTGVFKTDLKDFKQFYTGATGTPGKIAMADRNDDSHWELHRINEFYNFTETTTLKEYANYPIEGLSITQFPPSFQFHAGDEALTNSLEENYTVNVFEQFSTIVEYKEDVSSPNNKLKDKLRRYKLSMTETLKSNNDTFADCLTERGAIFSGVPYYMGEVHYGECPVGSNYTVNAIAAKKTEYDDFNSTNYLDVHPILGTTMNANINIGLYLMLDGSKFNDPLSLFNSAALLNFEQYNHTTSTFSTVVVPSARIYAGQSIKSSDELKVHTAIELIKFLPRLTPYLTPAGGVLMFISLIMLYCACKGKKGKSVTAP